ncbi:MAG: ABC transporter ATP-binding protein [Erysipelotrichaceae bacterium]
MKTMLKLLKMTYKRYKGLYFVLLAQLIVNSLFSVFTAYSLSLLISCFETGDYENSVKMVIFIVVVEAVLLMLRRINTAKFNNCQLKMEETVNQMVSEKIMELPFNYLEDARYMQLKDNAVMGINNMGAIYDFFNSTINILTSLLTIAALSVVIAQFDYKLVILLFVGAVISFVITNLSTKTMIKFFRDLLPINFKYGYYLDTIISISACKEFRLYSLFEVIEEKFKGFAKEIVKYLKRTFTIQAGFEFAISLVRYVILAFIYLITAVKTISAQMAVSNFTLTSSAAISFSNAVSEMINSSGRFLRAIEYVKPIITFMEIEPVKTDGDLQLDRIDTIEFDRVSFHYPNTEKLVLDDVSFKINAKEKISIVGLNGAGKSTIVKLICMLYKPDQGMIKVNGVDIYQYDYLSYIKHISSIFQDYKLFNFSIKDNIAFDISDEQAESLLRKVNIFDYVSSLKNGIHSNINKEYDIDGILMSTGQLQKIAIARGLAKDSDFIILDEPTSALDPLAEAEIYENFNQLTAGKSAIFISHRMSSSIFCDKILVLDQGKVVDFAPHQVLMEKKDSLYYKMFTTQAENYQLS